MALDSTSTEPKWQDTSGDFYFFNSSSYRYDAWVIQWQWRELGFKYTGNTPLGLYTNIYDGVKYTLLIREAEANEQ